MLTCQSLSSLCCHRGLLQSKQVRLPAQFVVSNCACVSHVSHVCSAWINPTTKWPLQGAKTNAANLCVSVYVLSHSLMTGFCATSVPFAAAVCSSQFEKKKIGRGWKELHPSVRVWVTERWLESWCDRERVLVREGGNTEWALSFEGQAGKSKTRLHRWCLLLRIQGRWGLRGERSSSLRECADSLMTVCLYSCICHPAVNIITLSKWLFCSGWKCEWITISTDIIEIHLFVSV